MNIIITLLVAIASLLANPKVQANPTLLAEVRSINNAANVLVEKYTTIQGQVTPPPTLQGQDTQTNPTGLSYQNPIYVPPLPTSTDTGSPIVYVGEQDTQPAPPQPTTCNLTVRIATSTPTPSDLAMLVPMSPDGYMDLGTVMWELSGFPSDATGTLTSNLNDGEHVFLNSATGYNTRFNAASMFNGATEFMADFNGTKCFTATQ